MTIRRQCKVRKGFLAGALIVFALALAALSAYAATHPNRGADTAATDAFGGGNSLIGANEALVVDLEGDGFAPLPFDRGIAFDFADAGDGVRTEWVSGTCGILVRDLDHDGAIASGRELFGNNTMLENGELARGAREALRDLDANGDGVVDSADPAFSELMLWIDADSDAVSRPDELHALEEKGMVSIEILDGDADGSEDQASPDLSFFRVSSSGMRVYRACGVVLCDHASASATFEELPVPDDVALLPDFSGMGALPSLHQSMARDGTGRLKALLERFVAEPDRGTRLELTEQVLQAWTGETDRLKVLEVLAGASYDGPTSEQAMDKISSGYDWLVTELYCSLMVDSHLKGYCDRIRFEVMGAANMGAAADMLLETLERDQAQGEEVLIDFVYSMGMLDPYSTSGREDLREALDAVNRRYGVLVDSATNDLWFSQPEAREMEGSSDRANLFIVAEGDHVLLGGASDDAYVFSAGAGACVIDDPEGAIAIVLWDGVDDEDVVVERRAQGASPDLSDVLITVQGQEPSIRIEGLERSRACSIILSKGDPVDAWGRAVEVE